MLPLGDDIAIASDIVSAVRAGSFRVMGVRRFGLRVAIVGINLGLGIAG